MKVSRGVIPSNAELEEGKVRRRMNAFKDQLRAADMTLERVYKYRDRHFDELFTHASSPFNPQSYSYKDSHMTGVWNDVTLKHNENCLKATRKLTSLLKELEIVIKLSEKTKEGLN